MCIYCGTDKYRKIYENHHGLIPQEPNGVKYHIHHIDGNHSNNDPSNLKAVTVKEHYEIHKKQGDLYASLVLAARLSLSKQELSTLATESNLRRVKNGTHPFLKRPDGSSRSSDRVKAGNCVLSKRLDGSSMSLDRVKNGTHHLLNGQKGKTNSRFIDKTFTFENEELQIKEQLTQYEFYTKYNLDQGNVNRLIAGKHKTIKGWKVIQ